MAISSYQPLLLENLKQAWQQDSVSQGLISKPSQGDPRPYNIGLYIFFENEEQVTDS